MKQRRLCDDDKLLLCFSFSISVLRMLGNGLTTEVAAGTTTMSITTQLSTQRTEMENHESGKLPFLILSLLLSRNLRT